MEVIKFFFKLIIILSTGYLITKSNKIKLKQRKEYMMQIKNSGGRLATPKECIVYFVTLIGGMYAFGIVITLIIFYIRKMEFIPSKIFSIAVVVFIAELSIISLILFIINFVQDCKKRGVARATLTLIVCIILIVGVLYVRYNY